MDFFDDEDDDASSSDQPTRESRRIPEPEPEEESVAPPERAERPERRARASRPRPAPRSGSRRSRGFDDPPVPGGGGGGGAGTSRSQIRSRQLTLIGISIVVLILLFLAFRGCLDARKERSFKNYVSDLSALTVETKQLSDSFFQAFGGNSDEGGDVALAQQINGDRGTAQGLLERAEGLDAPDDLSSAQNQIALSYRLRRDALEVIALALPNTEADNDKQSGKAAEKIEEQMRVLSASDILYQRARFEIESALDNQEIVVEEGVPQSQFLPDEPNYLDLGTVEDALSASGVSSGGSGADCDEAPDDGLTHGLELSSVTAQPAGIALTPDAPNSVAADGTDFEIAVTNGGEAAESGIDVELGGDFSGSQTIDRIDIGETATVTVPPQPRPAAGDSGSLEVTVATVCGEELDTNNSATYEITFE